MSEQQTAENLDPTTAKHLDMLTKGLANSILFGGGSEFEADEVNAKVPGRIEVYGETEDRRAWCVQLEIVSFHRVDPDTWGLDDD